MSRRSALVWAIVFVVLALLGSGGGSAVRDALPGDEGDDPGTGGARLPDRDGRERPGALLRGRVTRVVDGDTVKVRLEPGGRTDTVRYIGVDTPESVKPNAPVQCFAKQASEFNRRLVEGRPVRLRIGREERDRYGRLLAYVYVVRERPVLINALLIRAGYARTLEISPNTDRADLFSALERRARNAGRGLWGACDVAR